MKGIVRDIEGQYIRDNPTKVYNPSRHLRTNIGAPKYLKQILMNINREIERNMVIVRDFHTPLIPMGRSSRQNIYKETVPLNDTQYQKDLIDILEHFTPKQQNICTF